MKIKYTKKEYQEYVGSLDKNIGKPVSFEMWKKVQPIADGIVGKANKIIKGIL